MGKSVVLQSGHFSEIFFGCLMGTVLNIRRVHALQCLKFFESIYTWERILVRDGDSCPLEGNTMQLKTVVHLCCFILTRENVAKKDVRSDINLCVGRGSATDCITKDFI